MTSIVSIQNSLSAGELSPSLYGRQDLEKYHSGTSTCRNFFVNYRGGVMSRAGLAYVGTCKQPGTASPPRDIPFQFSLNQGLVLEFGDVYMRIKSNGAYVTEATTTIVGISQANPASINITSHGYSIGDWIYITGVAGMTNFNGLTWIVNTVPDANHVTVTDLFGNVIDSTNYSAYTSGGTAARIYTVTSPYAAVDLPYLKYIQSADTMTLTCVNSSTLTEYPPYDLVRSGATNWTFTAQTFGAVITAPTGLKAVATSSTIQTTWYSYTVTAIDSKTNEESVASAPVNVYNNDISLNAGSNTLSWNDVPGAAAYNVYAATPAYSATVPISSLFGFIGRALGPSFVDTNIQPAFSSVPPVHKNPFARGAIKDVVPVTGGIHYSQGTVGYSITTSTGTGFSGTPVIANGQVAGMLIADPGQNYAPADTISFTDSGGGVAIGSYTFTGNPASGFPLTFTINGVAFELRGPNFTAPNAIQIICGNTLALTLQSIASTLNASTNPSIIVATYTANPTQLLITYKTPGSVGNSFTLTASSGGGSTWAVSASTLLGGGVAGTGATATLTVGPSSKTYPGVSAYFQQRRVYASSLNNPDTYWMSQPGLFKNMDSSIPVTASDAITGTPWAQQVNGIQFLVPMPGGLVTLTGKGAWQVNGGSQAAITPATQNATPQAYNGCNNIVPPIVINYDILYVQAKGSVVRDLSYNFFVNIYTGTDMTVLSNHLFTGHQILQWAYAEEPYKLIWAVREDGILLCLTYLKEQDVYAWTRHDTNGQFVSVCSVTEPPVDAVYVIVKRYIQGAWRYYSERMDNRVWTDTENCFCVDAGLSLPMTLPVATLSPTASTGSSVTFNASAGVFTAGMVGSIIRVGGGKATITNYNNATQVVCNITQPITTTVPNDGGRPVPAVSGNWSISAPITVLSGLNHLEGNTVAIVADGSVVPSQIVTNGTVTLTTAASDIAVGLPYTCQVQTLYLDHPTQGGNTVQNRRKTISAVGVRAELSRGLQIGADQIDSSTQQDFAAPAWINMTEIKDRSNQVNAGTATPLFTGDWYQAITSGWRVTGQVAIQQSYPLPASVLSVISYSNLGDDK